MMLVFIHEWYDGSIVFKICLVHLGAVNSAPQQQRENFRLGLESFLHAYMRVTSHWDKLEAEGQNSLNMLDADWVRKPILIRNQKLLEPVEKCCNKCQLNAVLLYSDPNRETSYIKPSKTSPSFFLFFWI